MFTIPDVAALLSTGLGVHIQKMVVASVLTVVSFLLAKLVQVVVVYVLDLVNAENFAQRIKLKDLLKKTELCGSISQLIGDIVFWGVFLSLCVAVIYSMQFLRALFILRMVLAYVTIHAVSASFVLVLSVVLASFLSGVILFLGGLINLPGYKLIARVFQYAIVIFGIVVGLDKLGISTDVFLARPDIILGFFALSGAIAFGLGCKDLAENFLANFLRNGR